MSDRRVVITGLGPVTPLGVGVTDFWNALVEGRSAVKPIEAFDATEFPSRLGAEVENVKVNDYVPKSYRKSSKIMARDIVLAVVAAHQAALDAGLRTKCLVDRGDVEGDLNVDGTRFGANIGAASICADLSELAEALHASSADGKFDIHHWGESGMYNLTPLWLLKFLPNMLACHVTIVHDAQSPSNTITCGEASSHLAIGEAFRTIARGVADVCICGGAESKLNPMALLRQTLGIHLTHDNESKQAAVRPYAANRGGSVVSEGGGLVILESLEHARGRGARIYAELTGFGAANENQTAAHPRKPHPDGRGFMLAANKALKDAGISAAEVDLIAPFGSAIQDYDTSEARGMHAVFGDRAAETPVLSIQGGMGNNGAGSGAINFIAAVLAMHNATLPAACNTPAVDPALNLKLSHPSPVDVRAGTVLSTAYNLNGGQNAALVIRKYRD